MRLVWTKYFSKIIRKSKFSKKLFLKNYHFSYFCSKNCLLIFQGNFSGIELFFEFEKTPLYMVSIPKVDMVNRVVSTKLTEEEHSRFMEICNDNGMTISSMLKRSIIDQIKKENSKRKKESSDKTNSDEEKLNINNIEETEKKISGTTEQNQEERFLYF
ncbi:MAG: hypothetical protein DWQ18_06190 [Crenarchaeota archaeon]|nr:MAG: hypothetical protein DWQ17_03595 [Thermoproteota archaeon]RDJ32790.1 MAG: hypothetical protein DWQ18_06190 [Thermoproteota archaeon]RDJ37959.1 MAG: hypothetical protein DWQ13_04820 [Thermoproteota archaeon]RDJ38376.1 MAG: hypothetical protein DWQ19_00985 [Thermoproteota archaeon]